MNNSIRQKNIKFIIIVSICIVIGVVAFTLITTKTNPFRNLIGTIASEKVSSVENDNYNGFYTKKDLLDATYKIYNGCSIFSVDNIILVQDENYTLYRSSCMGTYVKEKGKTKDLEFETENNKYIINYKKSVFKKDTTVNHVVENNIISSKMKNINTLAMPIIVKETEFEGNYYNIDAKIDNIDGSMSLQYKRDEANKAFDLLLFANAFKSEPFYSKQVKDGEDVPLMYGVGKQIVIIETDGDVNKYDYKFKSYNGGVLSFDLSKYFPIKIDGNELNYGNNSIYIKYKAKDKSFILLVGNDRKFCLDKSNSEKAVSYVFNLNYNYSTNKFDSPEYVKSIKGADGCSEIESYMGD